MVRSADYKLLCVRCDVYFQFCSSLKQPFGGVPFSLRIRPALVFSQQPLADACGRFAGTRRAFQEH